MSASYYYANAGICNYGSSVEGDGQPGRVRLEAFQHSWSFRLSAPYTQSSPLATYVPTSRPPGIRVVGIAGQSVPPNPTGSFDTADVTIQTSEPVVVNIEASGVPVGTIPKVYTYSLEGGDQVIDGTPLAGTLETANSTANVTFPSGYSRGWVRAVWTPSP